MQSLTEKIFHLAPPGGFFNATTLAALFPDCSDGARIQLVNRACRAGEILRLRPGAFLLAPPWRKSELHPFVLAGLLHSPSHVSMESALAFHGLIPDAVWQVASVTPSRSREFSTPVGVFSFLRVPAHQPFAGVESLEVAPGNWAFVASPLRALADALYFHREITWKRDGADFLTKSLRIEDDDLASLSFEQLDEISGSLDNRRVSDYLKNLKKHFHHA